MATDLDMGLDGVTGSARSNVTCPSCGQPQACSFVATQRFIYAGADGEVTLSAEIPIIECQACNEAFTGKGAEEIKHAAVCRHLGRLTPAEIRGLRNRLGLTQAGLAERTGIGVASIKRWELGNLIQSASLDAALRSLLASEPDPKVTELIRACKAVNSRLLAFVGATCEYTDCGPDVDAITRAERAIEAISGTTFPKAPSRA